MAIYPHHRTLDPVSLPSRLPERLSSLLARAGNPDGNGYDECVPALPLNHAESVGAPVSYACGSGFRTTRPPLAAGAWCGWSETTGAPKKSRTERERGRAVRSGLDGSGFWSSEEMRRADCEGEWGESSVRD